MNKIYHYSVFAAAPGGGKQFAIVEGVSDPEQMQRIAAQSGQPLTGFISSACAELVEARFFSPKKEKGASDSGALVVGEHLRHKVRTEDRLQIQMGHEELEIFYQEKLWWSRQEDMCRYQMDLPQSLLLDALGLDNEDLHDELDIAAAGGAKKNIVIPVWQTSEEKIKPDLDALAEITRSTQTNGVIVLFEPYSVQIADWNEQNPFEEWFELRFFAPAKGISEDNAGSYTVASVCAYLNNPTGEYKAIQGRALGKPSQLQIRYSLNNQVTTNILVGGNVELLEVDYA